MPGVSRVFQDMAGGLIIEPLAPTVFVNGTPVTCFNAAVQWHDIELHAEPHMLGHSNTVFANGIPICRQGDNATCGHISSGSSNVFSN